MWGFSRTIKMKNVFICDAMHEVGFEILRKENDIKVVDATNVPKDELLKMIGEADVAITRSSTDCNEKFINAAKNLKALIRAGVGVDNVDLEECSKRGIVVMNVPTANTIAAVEMTMCHLLNSARKFINSSNDLKHNRIWKREKWYGIELYKKTLGIIGFGNIGSRVAVRAQAFDMNVIAYDPYIDPAKVTDIGAKYTTNLDEIFEKSDFITIHTPKNKETINIIGDDEIKKLKDGVRLINCARGGLYNEEAIYRAAKSGKISYIGIDVFAKEPSTANPLLDLENLSPTPHLGANTYESQRNIAIAAAEQAIDAARGLGYPNALNLPIKTEEIPPFAVPYVDLITKMAYFASQLNKFPIRAIRLEANGKIAEFLKSLLTFAIVGALKESMGEKINYVNAIFQAKDKGILMDTATVPTDGYKNKLTVKITTEKGISSVSGTVFGENETRIVNINGFKTDFAPKGKMIIFKNTDVPGVIRDVTTILAQENINIADFRLGRNDHGLALAVILVDENISKNTLKKLNELPSCRWVEYCVL